MKKILFFSLLLGLFLTVSFDAQALTVSPAKIEIVADPGQTVRGEVELFNEQEETKTFYSSYENFESRGDSGAPYFIGAENGLATWIASDSEVTLTPGERIQVPYSISIPSTAKPGGYFAALFFGSQPTVGTEGGEVTIGGKIGVLILLKVSGDVEESAGLTEFETKNEKRFFSTLPIVFEYGFNNAGGDRVVPRGEIKIKNTLQLTSATLLANDREGSVLPDSTRRFDAVWGEKQTESQGFFQTAFSQLTNFHFGWYRAHLNLVWGESSQTASSSYDFFIIPWQLLSLVLLVLICIRVLFVVWLSGFKKKILAEATRTNR